ncbi:MAG: hypothetical protein QNK80_04220 [Akkermansiaceae bacterium]
MSVSPRYPTSLSDAGQGSKEEIQTKCPVVVTPPGHTSEATPGAVLGITRGNQ